MRKGFIIVEWMIQFLLCTLLGILAFMLFRTWSSSLIGIHKALDGSLQIPIACDVLRRDLQVAMPAEIEIASEHCTIKTVDKCIRWQLKKGTLMRASSYFDTKQKRWKKSVKNVAAEGVGRLQFIGLKPSSADKFTGIKLVNESGAPLCVISFRNGKLI